MVYQHTGVSSSRMPASARIIWVGVLHPRSSRLMGDEGQSSLAVLGSIAMPTSRSDLVAERLRRAILRGELTPGTALVERDIAAQLSVSKTPVREALIS